MIRFMRLTPTAKLPTYATGGSAGADLYADFEETHIYLKPGERRMFFTGLAMEMPPGFEGQVRPRSGLALKHGITVLNSPGTIDADFRGNVGVTLINLGQETVMIRPGDRIAQIIFARAPQQMIFEVDRLTDTKRGTGGLGSTGIR